MSTWIFYNIKYLIKIRELEEKFSGPGAIGFAEQALILWIIFEKKRFKESISKLDEILSRSKSGFIDPSVSNTGETEPVLEIILFLIWRE